jgi:hypothetical protein
MIYIYIYIYNITKEKKRRRRKEKMEFLIIYSKKININNEISFERRIRRRRRISG